MASQNHESSRLIKDQEIDDLLSKLSMEELEELQIELVDPDVCAFLNFFNVCLSIHVYVCLGRWVFYCVNVFFAI